MTTLIHKAIAAPRSRRLAPRTRHALWAYLFITPLLLYFVVWIALPVLAAFALSFTDYDTARATWVGLSNYRAALSRPEVRHALANTLQFGVELIPLNMAISLGLALLVDRQLRGIALFRTAYYLPVLTSLVVAGIVWTALYDLRTGPINALLRLVGLPPQQWLKDPALALHAVVLVRVWKGVGYNMMVFLAGLQTIPQTLYEAAMIDGANAWQRFRHVTWPMLRPTTFYIFVLACISAFQVFGEIYVMTKGGPAGATKTLIYLIYEQAFQYTNMGYASALAFVLFLIVGALAIFNLVWLSRRVDYER
ncbi:carbohydrate ABC transporter permease [Kallotenue papyrolyticum]|uniref:carbohydrate ABC transporter permease n=1 Tax=Kallotenue papyrolyticum TaxID=1325125 RepID=UPI0004AD7F3E|nr:sugar ABC transporter permease [Kallotenue papyrolyticum]